MEQLGASKILESQPFSTSTGLGICGFLLWSMMTNWPCIYLARLWRWGLKHFGVT